MKANAAVLRADALLLLTAAIWGFAFVAQRAGMEDLGPFAFNAVRFALGSAALVPLALYRARRRTMAAPADAAGVAAGTSAAAGSGLRSPARRLVPPLVAGCCLFIGASLQQVGLVTTTAGNAAFVTSLYVVLVPLVGLLFGRKAGLADWAAAAVAMAGLYLITVGNGFSISPGDRLELAGALFWTLHILVIDRYAPTMDPVALSAGQFAVCSALSLATALAFEPAPFAGLAAAAVPVLYGGLCSCGVAYTLQVVAQKSAPPAHASILLALEGLFGAVGGVLLLGEPMTARLVIGGALMLTAAIGPRLRSMTVL